MSAPGRRPRLTHLSAVTYPLQWPAHFRERHLIDIIHGSHRRRSVVVIAGKEGMGVSTVAYFLQQIFRLHGAVGAPVSVTGVDSFTDDASPHAAGADHVIVVTTPTIDGVYSAVACLDRVMRKAEDRPPLDALVAINQIRRMPFTNLLNVDRHFAQRSRRVIRLPWDARVRTATTLDELGPTARTGLYELAAAIVTGPPPPPTE